MKPLFSQFSHKGLEFFKSSDFGLHFVWDPKRVALAEIPLELNQDVWNELSIWREEPDDSRFQSLDSIRTLTINVTQVCNLKCFYCAAGGDGTYGKAQKRADIERVVPRISEILNSIPQGKTFRVTFSGGEPLLYPEGIEVLSEYLVEQSQKLNFELRLGIVTNGTLLTDKNLKLLSRFIMDLTVSLDGAPEQNHSQRPTAGGGDPTQLIEAGLKRISDYKSQLGVVMVSGVFNKNNLDLQKAFQYYSRWKFDLYDFNFDYFETDPKASEAFSASLIDLGQTLFQKNGLEGVKKILFFKRIIEHLDTGIKLSHHCGAGQSYVAMDARGDLYACPWKVGDEKFKIERPSGTSLYESKNRPNCSACWASPLCGGGCQFQHDSSNPNQIELFCQRMKSLLASAFMFYIKWRQYEQTN